MISLSKYILEKLIIDKNYNSKASSKNALILSIMFNITDETTQHRNHIELDVKKVKDLGTENVVISKANKFDNEDLKVSYENSVNDNCPTSKIHKLVHGGEGVSVVLFHDDAIELLEKLQKNNKLKIDISEYVKNVKKNTMIDVTYFDKNFGYHREYTNGKINSFIKKLS